jgi:hypothetical protein
MKTRTLVLALVAGTLAGCLNRVSWLADGRRLVYLQDRAIWLITLDGQRTKLGETGTLENPEVAAAPKAGLIAITGVTAKRGKVILLTEGGTVAWTGTLPGEEAQVLPGGWSADGARLLVWGGKTSLLVETAPGTARVVETGDAPRFTSAGDLVSLRLTKTGATLARRTGAGAETTAAWKLPAGIEEPSPLLLTGDGTAAWWKGKRGGHFVTALAGADGRLAFSTTRTLMAAGPDGRSYLTEDGGYALMSADRPALNLNPAYNALLRMDINWQLADPRAAAEKYDAGELLKSAPAFSPDGTRAAILTPHLLCVVTLKTGEAVAIAKW